MTRDQRATPNSHPERNTIGRPITLRTAHESLGRPRTVLIIDDDEGIRAALADIVHDEGVVVATASDGARALDYLGSNTPQLIFLDLMMPGVNGWEFITEIRRRESAHAIPIVLVSSARSLPEEAARLGVWHYLRKPFQLVDVTRAIQQRFAVCTTRNS